MDENAKLLLQKASRAPEWEDEERATYDQETLRQEIWQERLKAWINRVKDDHPSRKYLPLE